jgi:hypothetical protein
MLLTKPTPLSIPAIRAAGSIGHPPGPTVGSFAQLLTLPEWRWLLRDTSGMAAANARGAKVAEARAALAAKAAAREASHAAALRVGEFRGSTQLAFRGIMQRPGAGLPAPLPAKPPAGASGTVAKKPTEPREVREARARRHAARMRAYEV